MSVLPAKPKRKRHSTSDEKAMGQGSRAATIPASPFGKWFPNTSRATCPVATSTAENVAPSRWLSYNGSKDTQHSRAWRGLAWRVVSSQFDRRKKVADGAWRTSMHFIFHRRHVSHARVHGIL
ncbi:hypothetical protein VDGL01_08134 [Verticillium dahliae]